MTLNIFEISTLRYVSLEFIFHSTVVSLIRPSLGGVCVRGVSCTLKDGLIAETEAETAVK